jgi:small subunit ribosomal protein S21
LTKPQNREKVRLEKLRREVSDIAYIEVSDDEPLEKAIKRFKRQVEKEGIIREWKKREFFEKPSAILNRKKKALERKRMKRARKVSQMKSY